MKDFNTPEEAVKLAEALVGTGIYRLGTGDCDTPVGDYSDCAGFAICRCYSIRRHRPGFNKGAWASVEDDINCNSAIEDADHKRELFERVLRPEPGCLLTYPTIVLDKDHAKFRYIGHVAIVVGVPAEWDARVSRYAELTVVQCCGPNGHYPGIVKTNAAHWDVHDKVWPKAEHKTAMLRIKNNAKI